MKKVIEYLNPISRLGNGHYSFVFPLVANIALCVLSEFFAYGIFRDPMSVGGYIIFLNVAYIIYFAFRDGVRGGLISSAIAILYYFYIIYTRHYSGSQLSSGINTTVMLAVIYFVLAITIGWLKQRIDKLIEREADGKRRLETIIQQLPVGILITDGTGRMTQRNRQLDNILGIKIPMGFTVGRDTLRNAKINGREISPSESPLVHALKTGRAVIGREMIFERKDGKKLVLQVSSAPIHNKNKKIIAAASIINDISKQKELERQKDEFLGIASHELKTPVTSIKAYAQVLQVIFSRKGDTKAVEQLQKMDTQVNKLTNLISDLLDVTKIQQGRLEFHEEYFDFNDLVAEIVEELQLTTRRHKIIKQLGKSKNIYADRERIGQVLVNLLSNAIKYSPNSKKIIVTTNINKGQATFCVEDFGVGIPKDKKNKVFEQFFRVSGPAENTFPGLGLGLYVSSEIVKREGGRIWVESAQGRGSTFCFSLPIKKLKQ